jgi:hypothetical protein
VSSSLHRKYSKWQWPARSRVENENTIAHTRVHTCVHPFHAHAHAHLLSTTTFWSSSLPLQLPVPVCACADVLQTPPTRLPLHAIFHRRPETSTSRPRFGRSMCALPPTDNSLFCILLCAPTCEPLLAHLYLPTASHRASQTSVIACSFRPSAYPTDPVGDNAHPPAQLYWAYWAQYHYRLVSND